MRLRGQTELFALAERARREDDIPQGAVGAAGHGFALANQIESQRFISMGAKLSNLPDIHAGPKDAGRVLTLTGGIAAIRGHYEELFNLTLFCAGPDGAQERLRFYHGPSGLALGEGKQLHRPRGAVDPSDDGWQAALGRIQKAADTLTTAWEKALAKVFPTPFELTVDSDFGKSRLGWPEPVKGKPKEWSSAFPGANPEPLRAALAGAEAVDAKDGGAACRAMEEVEAARDLLTEKARTPLERRYEATCQRLWMPALDHLERALRAAPGFDLPRDINLLTSVLPYAVAVPRERAAAVYNLCQTIAARRWAAHPWPF